MTNPNETNETSQAAAVAAQAAPVAPAKAKASKATNPTKKAATAAVPAKTKKTAKNAKAKPAASKRAVTKPAAKAAPAPTPRDGSKKQIVLDMMRTRTGATMAAIMKATGWQTHSVRGFVSGMVTKKMGLVVESTRSESGDRTYKITGK